MPNQPTCDFCSGTPVRWSYPARGFEAWVAGSVRGYSPDAWAACDQCHDLIERSDYNGLARRGLKSLLRDTPELRPVKNQLLDELIQIHQRFFSHRRGPATPYTVETSQ